MKILVVNEDVTSSRKLYQLIRVPDFTHLARFHKGHFKLFEIKEGSNKSGQYSLDEIYPNDGHIHFGKKRLFTLDIVMNEAQEESWYKSLETSITVENHYKNEVEQIQFNKKGSPISHISELRLLKSFQCECFIGVTAKHQESKLAFLTLDKASWEATDGKMTISKGDISGKLSPAAKIEITDNYIEAKLITLIAMEGEDGSLDYTAPIFVKGPMMIDYKKTKKRKKEISIVESTVDGLSDHVVQTQPIKMIGGLIESKEFKNLPSFKAYSCGVSRTRLDRVKYSRQPSEAIKPNIKKPSISGITTPQSCNYDRTEYLYLNSSEELFTPLDTTEVKDRNHHFLDAQKIMSEQYCKASYHFKAVHEIGKVDPDQSEREYNPCPENFFLDSETSSFIPKVSKPQCESLFKEEIEVISEKITESEDIYHSVKLKGEHRFSWQVKNPSL